MSNMKTCWKPAGMVFLGYIAIPPTILAQSPIAAAQPQGSFDTGELPKLERPSDPNGVGQMDYHWIDSKRPDRLAADSQVHRKLMVYFSYPTPRQRADIKGSYFPGAKEIDAVPALQRRMRKEFGTHWPSIVSGAVTSHASESAQAA